MADKTCERLREVLARHAGSDTVLRTWSVGGLLPVCAGMVRWSCTTSQRTWLYVECEIFWGVGVRYHCQMNRQNTTTMALVRRGLPVALAYYAHPVSESVTSVSSFFVISSSVSSLK